MSKREKYRQKLDELDELLLRNPVTDEEWQQYRDECDKLKDIATDVLIEQAQETPAR